MTDILRKQLHYRAWHRGTREADYMIGGFYDRHGPGWGADELAWFADFLEEDDVEIMGWALGTMAPPDRVMAAPFAPAMMAAFRRLDFIDIP